MSTADNGAGAASPSGNHARLQRLRRAIDDERPVDGIHNLDVERLYEEGGDCPRYLGCTSEGHWDSGYRDNPAFFVGGVNDVAKWLAASYEEGWAARWVLDLATGEQIGWAIRVEWSTDAAGSLGTECQ